MTLEHLRRRVRALLQEPDPQGRFPDEQLNDHINEAYGVVSERSEAMVAESSGVVEKGVQRLALPSDALGLQRVVVGNRVLRQTTEEQLDQIFKGPHWAFEQGVPQFYVRYTPSFIRLVPYPDEDMPIAITYSYRPWVLEHDEDPVHLPAALADCIPRYAVHLALKSDGKEPEAQTVLQEFEAYLADAISRVRRRMTKPVGTRIRLGG